MTEEEKAKLEAEEAAKKAAEEKAKKEAEEAAKKAAEEKARMEKEIEDLKKANEELKKNVNDLVEKVSKNPPSEDEDEFDRQYYDLFKIKLKK